MSRGTFSSLWGVGLFGFGKWVGEEMMMDDPEIWTWAASLIQVLFSSSSFFGLL
jgi:hypothetical protein